MRVSAAGVACAGVSASAKMEAPPVPIFLGFAHRVAFSDCVRTPPCALDPSIG
ncbi:hypothetical protein E3O57_18300 [Cryobacterium sp. TMN-39-2]|nr:hypothetical protein E3O57_18300 [Cryobacterium sp. TMN-39-2]